MTDFETLGAFYLGKQYDLASKTREQDLMMYDSRDLTTHAVIIGMTGSGKTGLGIDLLEEALIDRIPVIAIDPKGDLGNLALRFPRLSTEDFKPWVDPQQAETASLSLDAFAEQQAATWKKGIESWGQSSERIQRLVDSADVTIYTPGSTAGKPLSLLKAFDAPAAAIMNDAEALQERVNATTVSLLSLLGITADPVSSREHILIANILSHSWQEGRNLDLAALIGAIQSPPFSSLGVMPLDTVFPAKDRTILAMQLNNLLAAPGFQSWLQGDPINTASLLFDASGKPRGSVVSIAHLSDAERMFFVTLLLADILAWARSQPGTSSLRAILYIDELFGYMPPVANPPSKQLLLTLLKQARAFGLGIVLSTQNPVDLDYRGLSNTGTWFIGRLQTERDKMRVIEGLEGAAGGQAFDRAAVERDIAGLGKRVFLMHNVHAAEPVTFETRWTLSYLAGPMTREQIRTLTTGKFANVAEAGAVASTNPTSNAATDQPPSPVPASTSAYTSVNAPAPTAIQNKPANASGFTGGGPSGSTSSAPVLPADIQQFWIEPSVAVSASDVIEYRPAILGLSDVSLSNTKLGIAEQRRVALLTSVDDGPISLDWNNAERVTMEPTRLSARAKQGARFEPIPSAASNSRNYSAWSKALQQWLVSNESITIFRSSMYKAVSSPNQSEREFRIQLQQLAREDRDAKSDALRQKYASKVASMDEKIRRAEQALQREQQQASKVKTDTLISFGKVVGAFFGTRKISASAISQLGTAAKGVTRSSQQAGDVARASENIEALMEQKAALEAEMQQEIDAITGKDGALTEPLETVTVSPKSSDVRVQFVALVWLPSILDATGIRTEVWR